MRKAFLLATIAVAAMAQQPEKAENQKRLFGSCWRNAS